MTNEILKAKEILNKRFCLMEWQANDARARGETLMNESDIEYLLSLDGFAEGDVVTFTSTSEDTYDSHQLFDVVLNEQKEGKQGLLIMCATLKAKDEIRLKNNGCFIKQTGHGSVSWDEIYFSEEAYIKSQVVSFQNLFGGLASVAHMI